MTTTWQLTVDCASASTLADFWCAALGYEPAPPPQGFASWEDWLVRNNVPEEEWDSGAYIRDPEGAAPGISFLQVPETKTVKNRLHLDVQVGGGRHRPWEQRWARVTAEVERLTGLGARAVVEVSDGERPDHVVMADPEGNEFCLD